MKTKLCDLWFLVRPYTSTILVALLLVVAFRFVPQVTTLFPTAQELKVAGLWRSIQFVGYSYCVLVLFALAFAWVLEPRILQLPFRWNEIVTEARRTRGKSWKHDESSSISQPRPAAKYGLAVGLFASAAVLVYATHASSKAEDPSRYLDVTICYSASVLMGSWGLYYSLRDKLPPSIQTLSSRTLLAWTVFGLFGEAVWWAGRHVDSLSLRIYSIGAMAYVAFVVLLIAAVIDRWQSLYPAIPFRAIFGLLVIASASYFFSSPTVGTVNASATRQNSDAETLKWLQALQARLKAADSRHPVIFVSASGGGSRAALFSAMMYESLHELDKPTNDQRWTFESYGRFRPNRQVILVSSVSGGSLASACYTDRSYRDRRLNQESTKKNFYPDMITRMMAAEAERLDRESPSFVDLHHSSWDAVRTTCTEAIKQVPPEHAFMGRGFVDDMCGDFMAPLLRGLLTPGQERGEAVTSYWQQVYGLEDTNQAEYRADVPLWMSNSTDVGGGRPFVIGFPPLPQQLIAAPKLKSASFDRNIGDWKLTRAEAVRLSANFPWGFETAASPIHVRRKPVVGGEVSEPLNLIDGGVFDNSGVTTVRSAVEAIEALADADTLGSSPEKIDAIQLAAEIRAQLARRGVILLEIDSGAKPEPAGDATRRFSSVLMPTNALNNASYHNSERAGLDNVAVLQESLRDAEIDGLRHRLAAVRRFIQPKAGEVDELAHVRVESFHHLKATCNEEDNVMTAWALPPEDKAKIFVRSLVAAEELKESLRRTVSVLLQTRALAEELKRKTKEIELSIAAKRSVSPLRVRDLIQAYVALSEINHHLELEQTEKQAKELLYAQNGTPEQYAAVTRDYENKRKNFAVVAGKATQAGSPEAASDDLRPLLPSPLTGSTQSQFGSENNAGQSRVPQVRTFDGEADAFSRIKRRLAQ